MRVKVVRLSGWDFPGEFPTFEKGTPVRLTGGEDTDFLGWYACDIAGYETFVPITFVSGGKLIRDYNPTELTPKEGDILEVREIIGAWLLAANEQGTTGWVPAQTVVSVSG